MSLTDAAEESVEELADEKKQALMHDILNALVDDKFLVMLYLAAKCYPGMDVSDLYRELKGGDKSCPESA